MKSECAHWPRIPRPMRRACVIASCFSGILTVRGRSQEAPLDLEFTTVIDTLAQGLEYHHLRSFRSEGWGPLSAHVLRVDLDRIDVRHVLAMDQILGQESPTSMVSRYGALAGINGGFSVTNDPWRIVHGDPNGFFVLRGVLLSDPVEPRASFGICRDTQGQGQGRQSHRIVRPSVRRLVRMDGGRQVEVSGLNRVREADDLVVYTPEWGRSTITDEDGAEVVVAGGVVQQVSATGSTRIPDDGFVLSGSGANVVELTESIEVGDRLELQLQVSDLDRPGERVPLEGCSYSSAGPRVVRDGNPIIEYSEEEFRDAFTFARHPRTALGVDRDGRTLIVAVIDGRQPELSVGMTLPELALFLVGQGAVELEIGD